MSVKPVPDKLKQDAIVEAVFEARFDTTTLQEILFARIADHPAWGAFEQRRLQASEIPSFVREADPNLRYQPAFELAQPSQNRALRIGAHVLSYHRTAPYVGWATFQPELDALIAVLFEKADQLGITRLGFRYINALRSDVHGIRGLSDLDLTFTVAEDTVVKSVNVNFTTPVSEDALCTVRLATSDLIQGVVPPNTSLLVDVDVFTKERYTTASEKAVRDWVEVAHKNEKEQFFRLLKIGTIEALKER